MPDPAESVSPSRDALALRRTHLANERTLLAYVRTAIMLAASGVTLLKLPTSGPGDRALGAALLAACAAVALLGAARFRGQRAELGTTPR